MKELSITYLTPMEMLTTGKRIRQIVMDNLSQEVFVVKVCESLEKDVDILGIAAGKDKTSAYTQMLADKDALRDDAFLALRDYIKASSNRSDVQVKAAANLLLTKFKKHGWTLYSMGYSDQTAALNMLFEDLDAPDATAALQTISAENWYAELKNTQTGFETTYNNKVSSEAQEEYLRLREAMSVTGRHLNLLLENIAFLQENNAADIIDTVVDQIDEVITDVMTTVRARRTREAADEEEEATVEANEQSQV